jgi:hypothetical protein
MILNWLNPINHLYSRPVTQHRHEHPCFGIFPLICNIAEANIAGCMLPARMPMNTHSGAGWHATVQNVMTDISYHKLSLILPSNDN